MAAILQIRRGTSFGILTSSEPFFLTPNYTLNIGTDGSGGYITLVNLNVTNVGNIVLNGNITATNGIFTNDVTLQGNLYVGGDITLGNQGTDTIFVGAPFSGSLIPDTSSVYDLGSVSHPWRNLYADGAFITNVTASNVDFGNIQNLPSGLVSGSIQVNHNDTTGYVSNQHYDHSAISMSAGLGMIVTGIDIRQSSLFTLDTGSTHFIDAVNNLNNLVIPSGTISGSEQLTSSLDLLYEEIASGTHTLVSGSSQLTSSLDIRYELSGSVQALPNGLVSGSSQLTSSLDLRYELSGSLQTLPSGLVSGSSQISYPLISNIPIGIVSSSQQIYDATKFIYEARASTIHTLVSSSIQISYPLISNIPNGIISGSSQLSGSTIYGIFVGDGSGLTGVSNYSDTDTLNYINSISVLSGSIDLSQILLFTSSIQTEVNVLSSHTGSYLLNSSDTFSGTLDIVGVPTVIIYTEDFSLGTGSFTTYGDSDWYRVTDTGSGDLNSVRSGVIGNNQTSSLELVKTTTGVSTFTYDYFTSTDEFNDYLRVYVNGGLVNEYSGVSSWTTDSVVINQIGTITVKFVYEKDGVASGSEDAVWVDNISWVEGSEGDLNVDGIISAPNFTGSFAGDGSGLTGIIAQVDSSSLLSRFGDDMEGDYSLSGSIHVSGSSYFWSDLTVAGIITAQEFHTEFISSSIIYQSGSTKFGDTLDDTHEFTGSVKISGSLTITDNTLVSNLNADLLDSQHGTYYLDYTNFTNLPTLVSGSDQVSGSFVNITGDTMTGDLIVSASVNISGSVTSNLIIKSGSTSDDILLGDGTTTSLSTIVAGSGSQVEYDNILNKPTLISGSDQLTSSLDLLYEEVASGTHTLISGSSQLTSSLDIRYELSGSAISLPSGIISGSSQLDNTIITNLSGSFTGSFGGDGSGLSGLPVVVDPQPTDVYYGSRIKPTNTSQGFYMSSNTNNSNGYIAHALAGNTGNAHYIGYTLIGSASDAFTNGATFAHMGPNYYASYLRNQTILYTAHDLYFLGATNTSEIHFRLGNIAGVTVLESQTDSVLELNSDRTVTVPSLSNVLIVSESTGQVVITRNYLESYVTSSVVGNLPSGVVSGSSQINYPDISNIPNGIISGSEQISGSFVDLTSAQIIIGEKNFQGGTLFDISRYSTATSPTINTTTATVALVPTGSYDAIFFDYVIKNGGNMRAGTLITVYDGVTTNITDNTTTDLGDTTGLTMNTDIFGGDIRLRATTTSDGWVVKTIIRTI